MPDTNPPAAPNAIVEIPALRGTVRIGQALPVAFLAGPCVLESRQHGLEMSAALREIADRLKVDLVYKTSYDKANRTSARGYRGMGMQKSLDVFAEIRETSGLPIVTDVHTAEQCAVVAEVADILQIPAFLCRQTDLLVAAAETGRPVNVKKGQFLAPWDMKNVVDKLVSAGARDVMVCERGVSFGYNTLVNDMRALPEMAKTGAPVVFDATHSVQSPGGKGSSTGGDRTMVPILARAAAAVGIAAVFMEVHQDPDNAPSDGPNMVKLADAEQLMRDIMAFDALAKEMAARG